MKNIPNQDRAKVLVQALPYIQKYSGQTIVVKYGGNAMINDELKDAVMSDIVLLQLVGINVVLVH
ncbi:MAG: acetylglutamate kinase, partial [Acutalibacteraceae bacterium]